MTLEGLDSVVLADRFRPLREAANLVRGFGLTPVFIGDAKQPRHVIYAIHEGEEAASDID